MPFSPAQVNAIEVTEKVCSGVSFVASLFVISTFICSSRFQSPINRLIFYAAIGNVMTNIATAISRIGIRRGGNSALCQFQAFIFQWFMAADAFWSLCMACNVYLTLFRRYTTADLKKQEWKYLIFCYGIPFIPAFVFLFISNDERGKMYGPAVLWCFIRYEWDVARVAAFYGPVWVAILCTLGIYISIANVLFRNWRQFRRMNSSDERALYDVGDENPWPNLETGAGQPEPHDARRFVNHQDEEQVSPNTTPVSTVTRGNNDRSSEQGSDHRASFPTILTPQTHSRTRRKRPRRGSLERHRATWAYSKYAFLFFLSLLVTWVPSSANRIYSLATAPNASFGLNYASAFVLPLQGFWNCLVYTATSTSGVKALFTTKPRKPSIAVSFDNLHIKPSSRPMAPLKRMHANVRRVWTRSQ